MMYKEINLVGEQSTVGIPLIGPRLEPLGPLRPDVQGDLQGYLVFPSGEQVGLVRSYPTFPPNPRNLSPTYPARLTRLKEFITKRLLGIDSRGRLRSREGRDGRKLYPSLTLHGSVG